MPLSSSQMSSGEKIGCWRGGTVGLGWCTFHAVESERKRKDFVDVAMQFD